MILDVPSLKISSLLVVAFFANIYFSPFPLVIFSLQSAGFYHTSNIMLSLI